MSRWCGSLMRTFSQTSLRHSACRAEWRPGSHRTDAEPPVTDWSGHPSGTRAVPVDSDAPEAVDLLLEARPLLRVADPQTLLRSQGEDADLALVGVAVDVARGLADLLHRVGLGQRRMDQPPVDEPVGLPRLLVVGEVRADDPLEVHPQVAVVVLVQE